MMNQGCREPAIKLGLMGVALISALIGGCFWSLHSDGVIDPTRTTGDSEMVEPEKEQSDLESQIF